MDIIVAEIIKNWGPLGLLIGIIFYMVYTDYKASRDRKYKSSKAEGEINILGGKIDNLANSIEIVDTKVDVVQNELKNDIKSINKKVDNLPLDHIKEVVRWEQSKQEEHLKQLDDLIKLGPKLHRVLQDYVEKIESDHIFVGSFHNGNSSLSGIPYYKFDIIAERFCKEKIEEDCEFAHMYKDSDILRYDLLPIMLIQRDIIHFKVPSEGDVQMSKYDDIIWRRMRGRGIKQIALKLLKDSKDTPSGFVGCVKYDNKDMDLNSLKSCAQELEYIYHKSEYEGEIKIS